MNILRDKLEVLRLCIRRGGTDDPIIGSDIDGAIKRGLYDQNIGLGSNAVCHGEDKRVYDNEGNTSGVGLRWICSICGGRGFEEYKRKQTKYDKLVKKFHGDSRKEQ